MTCRNRLRDNVALFIFDRIKSDIKVRTHRVAAPRYVAESELPIESVVTGASTTRLPLGGVMFR